MTRRGTIKRELAKVVDSANVVIRDEDQDSRPIGSSRSDESNATVLDDENQDSRAPGSSRSTTAAPKSSVESEKGHSEEGDVSYPNGIGQYGFALVATIS